MSEFHPRQAAYPVAWTFRNGRWGEPFAVMQAKDIRIDGKWVTRYELRSTTGEWLGEFPTGDGAAVYAWQWRQNQSRDQHRAAATRQHERPAVKPNVPDRTERD